MYVFSHDFKLVNGKDATSQKGTFHVWAQAGSTFQTFPELAKHSSVCPALSRVGSVGVYWAVAVNV
jgi:hypothetical protein